MPLYTALRKPKLLKPSTSTTKKLLRAVRESLFPARSGINDLRRHAQNLDTVLGAYPGITLVIHDLTVLSCYGDVTPFLPHRPEELGDLIDHIVPQEQAKLRQNIAKLIDHGTPLDTMVAMKKGQHVRLLGKPFAPARNDDKAPLDTAPNETCILWLQDVQSTQDKLTLKDDEIAKLRQEIEETEHAILGMDHPIWIRDQHNNLTWCNTAYANLVDVSRTRALDEQTEILGRRVNAGRALASRARLERKTVEECHHIVASGGERQLYRICETPLSGYVKTVGWAINITDIEKTESELKRFKASTSELLRALNTGVAIFNPKTELSFFNDAFASLFHMEDIWLNQKPTLSQLMEAMREKRRLPEQADFKSFKKSWNEHFTSLIDQHEDMLILPDETAIRVVIIPHPLGGLFMTFEDVTSRLELESNYNTLIDVQRETLNNLGDALAVFGADGRLQLYNPIFARYWGVQKRTLDTQPHINKLAEKMSGHLPTKFEREQLDTLRTDLLNREIGSARLKLKNNKILEYHLMPLPDGGSLVRFSDMTDSVRVELALREKNAALEEAERLKVEFLANVSYQLRTPLNSILGFAEVLDGEMFGDLSKRQHEYTQGIMSSGQKLLALINDILDLSSIDAGTLELSVTEFDLYDMLESMREIIRIWAERQGIKLRISFPKTIGTIQADYGRLRQILVNLMKNAIKFTSEGGTIIMEAKRTSKGVQFTVKDSGVGMSEVELETIFTPFVQHRDRNAGAGLGLSLVKSIIELHHGHITVESEEDIGTKVSFFIPDKQNN